MKKKKETSPKQGKVVKKKKVDKKKEGLFKSVRKEMKKVTWPSRKDVIKYSIATIVFCIVIMLFFQVLDVLLSIVKGVFN